MANGRRELLRVTGYRVPLIEHGKEVVLRLGNRRNDSHRVEVDHTGPGGPPSYRLCEWDLRPLLLADYVWILGKLPK